MVMVTASTPSLMLFTAIADFQSAKANRSCGEIWIFSNFYLFKNHILEMILFHPFDHVNRRDAVLKVGRAIHLGMTKCHCGRRGRAAD
jgi:hypothetical protein